MLGAERLLMAGERGLRQSQRLGGPSAGDQREGQLAALAVRLRVIGAKTARRALQQILTGQDRLRSLVLVIQRSLERLSVDDSELDQVFANSAAKPFLARQGKFDVLFPGEALRNQQFTETHKRFSRNQLHST